MAQNPFISESKGDYTIGFKVPNKTLWWCGHGFKDLAVVRSHPEVFDTLEVAEIKIKSELLEFISKYRSDQIELCSGWIQNL